LVGYPPPGLNFGTVLSHTPRYHFGLVWCCGLPGEGGDDLLPVCYKNHSTNLLCLETELAATDKWRGEMVLVYRACGGDED
jgi:hypothetical protein